jgi:hypothetical protein
MNCPNCQKPIPPNARFCGSCGQSVNDQSAAPPLPEPPRPTIAAMPAAAIAGGGSTASLALPGLIERVKNIVLSPKLEWPVIAPEPTSTTQLYFSYVMPLSALAAVLSFVHTSIIGVNVPFAGTIRTPIASGLLYSIVAFGFSLVGLFLLGLIINALAPSFSGVRDQRQALKVAAYSMTPGYLSAALALSPVLPTLLQLIAGLYGIYVLYLGLPILMRSPRDKAVGYTASVVICTILLGILLGVLSATAGHFGMMPGSLASDSAAQAAAAQEQGANIAGNIIGNALGTDDKGKAGLTAALSNLAKPGQQSDQQSTASSTSTSSDSAQNPMGAAGGLLTALGGALSGPHRVDVVDFKALTPLLPGSLPGMKRLDAKGESQGAIGVKTSSATANYQGDSGSGIQIVISDMSAVSGLMDLAGALVQNTTSQSDSGYEKDTVIGGRSVHEKFDAKARKGDLSVLLAKRFQVEITGDGVDMSSLEQALGQVDLSHLESMKDQGAQPK